MGEECAQSQVCTEVRTFAFTNLVNRLQTLPADHDKAPEIPRIS